MTNNSSERRIMRMQPLKCLNVRNSRLVFPNSRVIESLAILKLLNRNENFNFGVDLKKNNQNSNLPTRTSKRNGPHRD